MTHLSYINKSIYQLWTGFVPRWFYISLTTLYFFSVLYLERQE